MNGAAYPHHLPAASHPQGPYPMGLMGILATVTMLFAAFTAAILMRRTGTDWYAVPLPPAAWANTIILAASSAALEIARRQTRRDRPAAGWIGAATALGGVFLVGQVVVWRILAGQGVFLPSTPHASFFYMLSAVHGLHVAGGLGALAWTTVGARRGAYRPPRTAGLTHAAIYWHFVGFVWLYVLTLLVTL